LRDSSEEKETEITELKSRFAILEKIIAILNSKGN